MENKVDKKMDKKIVIAIIILIIVLLSTITATYAYFTAIGDGNLSKFKLESVEFGVAYSEAGSNINLLVDGLAMADTSINETVPAASATNTTPVRVILETTTDGGTLSCNYDIVYVPTVPYINSISNLSGAKEYTIQGVSDQNGKTLIETDLGNVTNELVLIDNSEISVTGVSKKLIENWTFTVSYYNQSFSQDDNRNKTFGGTIQLKNIECENTVNKN